MRLVNDDVWAILTIYQEAGGEPMEGKVGVAEVIRNRIERKIMSDGTLTGTVLRPLQFSCWNGDSPTRIHAANVDSLDPTIQACMTAWHTAILGNSQLTGGATHYANLATLQAQQISPAWLRAGFPKTATIGKHSFYRQP